LLQEVDIIIASQYTRNIFRLGIENDVPSREWCIRQRNDTVRRAIKILIWI
jgi:hypothetical protein